MKILALMDAISDRVGNITAYLIPAMMLVMTYEVIARYVFNSPTVWAPETTEFLFIASTALGGAWLLLHRHHVNVSILYDRLSTRARAILDCVTSLFLFLFLFFLFRTTLGVTIEAVINLHRSPTYWKPPIYPIYIVMTAGILLIFFQGLVKLTRDVATALTGKAPVETHREIE